MLYIFSCLYASGEGNGNPLQYSCLENSMDGRAWGCKESDMTKQLHFTLFFHLYAYILYQSKYSLSVCVCVCVCLTNLFLIQSKCSEEWELAKCIAYPLFLLTEHIIFF